jgi:hypothetical protein
LAVGKGKKWEKALTHDLNIEEIQKKEEKLSDEERKALSMNNAAWSYLVWACQDRAFNIVDKVKDNVAFVTVHYLAACPSDSFHLVRKV